MFLSGLTLTAAGGKGLGLLRHAPADLIRWTRLIDFRSLPYSQTDGERLPLAAKDLGSCDMYPQTLAHNPNGRFVTVCGDGEFIIYTALAWRNKAFGPADEFVWSDDASVYATR